MGMASERAARRPDRGADETGAGGVPPPGEARRPLELGRARRSAIEALRAYRHAKDPASLAAVFQALADDLPAHWVIAGLLSVSSQLVDYLAASEKVDADDVVRALASIDIEDELGEELAEADLGDEALGDRAARRHEDAVVDEQGAESFPASDPPGTWAGRDDPDQPAPGGG